MKYFISIGFALIFTFSVIHAQSSVAEYNAGESSQYKSNDSSIPYKESGEITGDLVIRILTSFVVLVVIAIIVLLILRKYYYGKSTTIKGGRLIKILEMRRINAKSTLLLVEIHGRQYFLGQCDNNLIIIDKDIYNNAHEIGKREQSVE